MKSPWRVQRTMLANGPRTRPWWVHLFQWVHFTLELFSMCVCVCCYSTRSWRRRGQSHGPTDHPRLTGRCLFLLSPPQCLFPPGYEFLFWSASHVILDQPPGKGYMREVYAAASTFTHKHTHAQMIMWTLGKKEELVLFSILVWQIV